MLRVLVAAVLVAAASAFNVQGLSHFAAASAVRVAATPVMKKQGTSKSPPKDQKRRGKISKLCFKCDTPELVKDVLLGPETEQMLIKMNWRVRHSMKVRIKKRADMFGVEIPA